MAFTADKVRQGVQKDTGYSIDNSLRFNDAHLTKTWGSAPTDGNKFTYSVWVKRGKIDSSSNQTWILGVPGGSNPNIDFRYDEIRVRLNGTSYDFFTSQLFRDASAWYHLLFVYDSDDGTASDRFKLYVNGTRVTDWGTSSTIPSGTANSFTGNGVGLYIGAYGTASMWYDGYMSEIHLIDGQALDPTSFGETGTYGEWKPIEVTGMTYGTNGFYLDFSNKGTKHTITASGDVTHATARSKIGSSSIEFDGANDYLSIPQNADWAFGDGDWTIEYWINLSSTGSMHHIGQESGSNYWRVKSTATAFEVQVEVGGVTQLNFPGSTGLTSTNTWYHLAIVKSGSTATLYLDGTSVGTGSWTGSMGEIATPLLIGNYKNATVGVNGFMDEIRISNTARYTSGFTPSTTAFTEDANTLLLIHSDTTNGSTTFTDDSGVVGGLGNDASSNTNNWTVNNLAATDQMLDSPTNNFCTLNPWRNAGSTMTIAEGNLHFNAPYGNPQGAHGSTMAMTTGKWYWEVYINSISGANSGGWIGIRKNATDNDFPYDSSDGYLYRPDNGYKCVATTQSSYGASLSNDNILAFTYDADIGTLTAYVNNSTQGSLATGLSGSFEMAVCDGNSDAQNNVIFNFGQDSSFAGNKTAQGNQDSNSIGDFYYEPPTDFLALCTSNLPDPAVIPSEHFNTVLYTGTGSNQSINTVGFAPDLFWIKQRNNNYNHIWMDSVRGIGKTLKSDRDNAETDYGTGQLTSFDSDGFSLKSSGEYVNLSGSTYVAWNWKAGGTGASNTSGSITSTVSANADAGFSIVSYSGTGSGGTIGHGLSSAPEMVIVKRRDSVNDWPTQHTYNTTKYLLLNATYAEQSDTAFFNATAPTSSVYSVNGNNATNGSGATYIAYCFHSVDGYSKVGSYTGNGSADGTFVYTGFRPAYAMVKATASAEHWMIFDSERSNYNVVDDYFKANDVDAEDVNHVSIRVDFLSNGFKVRGSNAGVNHNGNTMIYLSFAEHPFKHTNAR
jgi:hypothetical protein